MVKFNIITGFLGSGKTTFLKEILKTLGSKHKIAIIQNEFAPSGVDGKELKASSPDFKLIEINNGSVFCVCQLNNFVQTVQKLVAEYQPELIFLEASGLADPISVAELLQTDELKDIITLNQIISLVDTPNFHKGLKTITRFKHQLMIGDLIILNKADLYKEDFDSIIQEIKSLNPYANIVKTSYAKVDIDLLKDSKNLAAKKHQGKTSEGMPEEIKACVLRSHDKIDLENLKRFLDELKESCVRIKGFVNLIDNSVASFHTIFEQTEIQLLQNYAGPTEVIAFGKDISIRFLRQKFKQYTL